jgi:molybdopterin-guanine dinucleotide biosynthesis protein A
MQNLITGCILAGGKGTRIGGDKLWKQYQGRCLVDYPLQLLKSMELKALVSVARDQPRQDLERLQQTYPEIQLIEDCENGGGPLVAIASVISQSPTDWVLMLPVDMPGLKNDDLVSLIEVALQGQFWAVVASVEGQVQPLVGLYSKSGLASIQEHFKADAARGPRSWLLTIPEHCQIVPALNPSRWTNINTPENLSDPT